MQSSLDDHGIFAVVTAGKLHDWFDAIHVLHMEGFLHMDLEPRHLAEGVILQRGRMCGLLIDLDSCRQFPATVKARNIRGEVHCSLFLQSLSQAKLY